MMKYDVSHHCKKGVLIIKCDIVIATLSLSVYTVYHLHHVHKFMSKYLKMFIANLAICIFQ